MDFSLMDDLNHFFDVFNTRTENSLKKNLPPESADIASKAVSEEVKDCANWNLSERQLCDL